MAYEFDLIVIGSGPAGQRAAVQASKLGKRVAVCERRKMVGGVCLHTGTMPSKTFREAVLSLVRPPHAYAEPSEVPRPTMETLTHRVAEVVERETTIVAKQLARNNVHLLDGDSTFIDPHTIAVSDAGTIHSVSGEHILIACGSRPSDPPEIKPDGQTILTSDFILSRATLPKSLVVVGGGVIGIEYASMFAELGVEVTLLDRHERPIEFVDREIVDELIHQMRQKRVVFRLGDGVAKITVVDAPTKHVEIELNSGKRLSAECVLYSVGRIGATAGLGLENAGLQADDRGRIAVDANYRTAVEHIYAAGDVIGFPSLASTSSEQGRLAALAMFGVASKPMGAGFPYGIYAIPEISMVGATEEELSKAKIPYEIGVARYSEIARGQILGDHSGFFKMLFHRETRKLLGVHCIGTQATELIHIGQAALILGGGLEYFLETVFNYPTLAECYKVAAYNAANRLGLTTEQ